MRADVLISSKLKLNCPGEQKALHICMNTHMHITHTYTLWLMHICGVASLAPSISSHLTSCHINFHVNLQSIVIDCHSITIRLAAICIQLIHTYIAYIAQLAGRSRQSLLSVISPRSACDAIT